MTGTVLEQTKDNIIMSGSFVTVYEINALMPGASIYI